MLIANQDDRNASPVVRPKDGQMYTSNDCSLAAQIRSIPAFTLTNT